MTDSFSFEIDDWDELLRRHHEISKTNFNMTPVKQQATMDLEKSEQVVWEATTYYEPLLRQRLMDRYRDEMPGDG